MSSNKYVVQVRTERGWATITQRANRNNAHRLAERLGGRVYNLWTRQESRTFRGQAEQERRDPSVG